MVMSEETELPGGVSCPAAASSPHDARTDDGGCRCLHGFPAAAGHRDPLRCVCQMEAEEVHRRFPSAASSQQERRLGYPAAAGHRGQFRRGGCQTEAEAIRRRHATHGARFLDSLERVESAVLRRQAINLHRWAMAGLRLLRRLLKQLMPVPQHCSWRKSMGTPMLQIVPGVCVLVSSAVCLEARHRMEYDAVYGAGTFALRVAWPRELQSICRTEVFWNPAEEAYQTIWIPGQGAALDPVLDVIVRLGGLSTTGKPPRTLPLSGYRHYVLYDYSTQTWLVTPKEAARLLYLHGPCIGGLYITADFYSYSNDDDDADVGNVFRGCTRDPELRALLEEEDERRSHSADLHASASSAFRGRLDDDGTRRPPDYRS